MVLSMEIQRLAVTQVEKNKQLTTKYYCLLFLTLHLITYTYTKVLTKPNDKSCSVSKVYE